MTLHGWIQIALYLGVLVALTKPLGTFMARVYEFKPLFGLEKVLGPVERIVYSAAGVKKEDEQDWKGYALACLAFNLLGLLAVYGIQRVQHMLPLNPAGMTPVSADSSFNTAVSFATNTNWQGYAGEQTMSYLTQMVALTVQNFVSAATGMAVLAAFVRGISRKTVSQIGSFWVDLVRSTLYVLLPLSVIYAVILGAQGVPQTFSNYKTVNVVQPSSYQATQVDASGNPVKDAQGNAVTKATAVTQQTIAVGPVASQIAIKQLGTNGGGFFNVNSAHPFENPNGFTNFLEAIAILLIPAALCYTFGVMVKDTRQGWAIFAAMAVLFLAMAIPCVAFEQAGNPTLNSLVDQRETALQPGGNMEGKEARLGPVNSAIWAVATTGASNGSVNSMHDSFTPLGGMMPMWMMQLSEVVFGGVGCGLYGMLIYAIVAVFIAGLMVGRTPEYLGKKIESYEMKMASIIVLVPPALCLIGTAIACVSPAGLLGPLNPVAHGFSEMLYAMSSQGNNNGSAFAGLSANTPFYNLLGGILMLFSRYWIIVPALAIAGSLARKKQVPASSGTLATHTPLFVSLLVGTVALVGALTFLPALALGPIVEHLMMAH
ncbi:MAG TPA: potassium-transporting ATPase subunit KdpA [Phycisphaerae bacterium]|nr:potassium-transporting ATPase subunit KdpA [Phycisphaerae bacterium]